MTANPRYNGGGPPVTYAKPFCLDDPKRYRASPY